MSSRTLPLIAVAAGCCGGNPNPACVEGVPCEEPDAGAPGIFFGKVLRVYLDALPTEDWTVSEALTIDTDHSPLCTKIKSGGDGYCVIVARKSLIDAAIRAIGRRPLLLVASDSITVHQRIDVGSHRLPQDQETIGAGADPVSCSAASPASAGAGGAGGSFGGIGGAGGPSSAGAAGGQPTNPVDRMSLIELRGGCPGSHGGNGGGGVGGHGGGAIGLVANNRIDIAGTGGINAAGESGAGGSPSASGGGGGGAGGMIVLDASTIVTGDSPLLANGGGGGEGASQLNAGAAGKDPSGIEAAEGGRGNSSTGGDGGQGSPAQPAGAGMPGGSGTTNSSSTGGGGGGGGGAGVIKATSMTNLGTHLSPPATP